MKRDERIDLTTLPAELLQELERELQPEAAPAVAKPEGAWGDSFRASGAKHF